MDDYADCLVLLIQLSAPTCMFVDIQFTTYKNMIDGVTIDYRFNCFDLALVSELTTN